MDYRTRGFKDYLRRILKLLPKQKWTGLFRVSAREAVGRILRVDTRYPVKIVCTILREPMELILIGPKPSDKSFNHFCLMQDSCPFRAIFMFKPITE